MTVPLYIFSGFVVLLIVGVFLLKRRINSETEKKNFDKNKSSYSKPQ